MIKADKTCFVQAIIRQYPEMDRQWCEDYAERLIAETDPRLEKNVLQWINGEPLEDIWIDKYCIGFVMELRGNQDFPGALEAMNLYLQDKDKGERRIWRMTM